MSSLTRHQTCQVRLHLNSLWHFKAEKGSYYCKIEVKQPKQYDHIDLKSHDAAAITKPLVTVRWKQDMDFACVLTRKPRGGGDEEGFEPCMVEIMLKRRLPIRLLNSTVKEEIGCVRIDLANDELLRNRISYLEPQLQPFRRRSKVPSRYRNAKLHVTVEVTEMSMLVLSSASRKRKAKSKPRRETFPHFDELKPEFDVTKQMIDEIGIGSLTDDCCESGGADESRRFWRSGSELAVDPSQADTISEAVRLCEHQQRAEFAAAAAAATVESETETESEEEEEEIEEVKEEVVVVDEELKPKKIKELLFDLNLSELRSVNMAKGEMYKCKIEDKKAWTLPQFKLPKDGTRVIQCTEDGSLQWRGASFRLRYHLTKEQRRGEQPVLELVVKKEDVVDGKYHSELIGSYPVYMQEVLRSNGSTVDRVIRPKTSYRLRLSIRPLSGGFEDSAKGDRFSFGDQIIKRSSLIRLDSPVPQKLPSLPTPDLELAPHIIVPASTHPTDTCQIIDPEDPDRLHSPESISIFAKLGRGLRRYWDRLMSCFTC